MTPTQPTSPPFSPSDELPSADQPVVSTPKPTLSRLKHYGIPFILLVLSIVTTTAIGARYMQNFQDGVPTVFRDSDLWPWPWLFQSPQRFLLGWSFSLTLLTILLVHELGHYFACRYHGIQSTLPWVLPAPSLSGTAGAVIQLRSRIPNRRALMDVGVYGPIAGYFASVIAVLLGFLLSHPASPDGPRALLQFGSPLTLALAHSALTPSHPGLSTFPALSRHPVLIAGWVGLFITALNLIPAGQLDGGHILYALTPRIHRHVTRYLPILLLVFGFIFWMGWILWALLLWLPALRHPKVMADQPLDRKRQALAVIALLILALTFTAAPFAGSSVLHYLQ